MNDKYPCEFIQDLLPAYVAGDVSDESAKVVSDHIGTCPGCERVHRIMTEDSSLIERSVHNPHIVDYMKKIRERRRRSILILLTGICTVGILLLLSLRHENKVLFGDMDYRSTDTVLSWNDGYRESFDYGGSRYSRMDLAEDSAFSVSSTFRLEWRENDPAFSVRWNNGIAGSILATDGISNMYQADCAHGTEIYYSKWLDSIYVRDEDREKLRKYYDDGDNYKYSVRIEKEGKDDAVDSEEIGLSEEIKLTASERSVLSGLKDEMADEELLFNCDVDNAASCLYRESKDRLYEAAIEIGKSGDDWYWLCCRGVTADPDDRHSYYRCCKLPASIGAKLDAAFGK